MIQEVSARDPAARGHRTPGEPGANTTVPMFFDCPAYLDEDGTQRCGLPAEVSDRYPMGSTGGLTENVRICCPSGHRFNGPIEFLTWHADRGVEQAAAPTHHPLTPAPAARRASDSPIRRSS